MKQLIPKQNYNVMSPRSCTHISVRDLYKVFPGLVCIFCSRKYSMWPILGIYKSLTDTWIVEIVQFPEKGNIYIPYSEGCWEQIQDCCDFFWHWQSVKLNLISRICKLVNNEPKCVKTKKKKQPDDYDDDEIVHDPGNQWLNFKILVLPAGQFYYCYCGRQG